MLKKRFDTFRAYIGFLVPFVILFPFFFITIQIPGWKRYGHWLTSLWGRLFVLVSGLKFEMEGRQNVPKTGPFILCPNHFSYLDIVTMACSWIPFAFVGKNSMERVPFFGYMYRNLHITVDRESKMSRYNTIIKSREALNKGYNLTIYPEGGIITKSPPTMVPFKDGAFRLAIEQQIPIIPCTIPFNWKVLPDAVPLLVNTKIPTRLVIHEPIMTTGMNLSDIESLKNSVFSTIEKEMNHQNKVIANG